jgi:hypothetical protein
MVITTSPVLLVAGIEQDRALVDPLEGVVEVDGVSLRGSNVTWPRKLAGRTHGPFWEVAHEVRDMVGLRSLHLKIF